MQPDPLLTCYQTHLSSFSTSAYIEHTFRYCLHSLWFQILCKITIFISNFNWEITHLKPRWNFNDKIKRNICLTVVVQVKIHPFNHLLWRVIVRFYNIRIIQLQVRLNNILIGSVSIFSTLRQKFLVTSKRTLKIKYIKKKMR